MHVYHPSFPRETLYREKTLTALFLSWFNFGRFLFADILMQFILV